MSLETDTPQDTLDFEQQVAIPLPEEKAALVPLPYDQLPKTEWEYVDPELAEQYLENNEGNRKVRADVVDTYSRDLKAGRWLVTGDPLRIDTTGRLIDGQHRLKAVVKAGIGAWFLVIRGVDPHVQSVLDTQAKRTAADALRFAGYNRNVRVISGVARSAIQYKDFMENRESQAALHSTIISNPEIEQWVYAHPEVHEAALMATQLHKSAGNGLVSWGMAYLKLSAIDEREAREFFTDLINMSTRGPGDPRHTLLQYRPVGKTGRSALGEMLIAITVAWNYYRASEDLFIIRTRVNGKYREIPVAN